MCYKLCDRGELEWALCICWKGTTNPFIRMPTMCAVSFVVISEPVVNRSRFPWSNSTMHSSMSWHWQCSRRSRLNGRTDTSTIIANSINVYSWHSIVLELYLCLFWSIYSVLNLCLICTYGLGWTRNGQLQMGPIGPSPIPSELQMVHVCLCMWMTPSMWSS